MEPISIAAGTLGYAFVSEAIKFLWSEAGKIMERYHKRRESAEKPPAELDDPAPAALMLPAKRTIDFAKVERNLPKLQQLIGALAAQGAGFAPVSVEDKTLLSHADELQALLVEIFGLPSEGLRVTAELQVDDVKQGGEAIAIDATNVEQGDLRGKATAKTVEGKLTTVKLTNH